MKTICVMYIITLSLSYSTQKCHSKLLRNNALISKIITNFQKQSSPNEEQYPSLRKIDVEYSQKPTKVMHLMQNILCKNFPSVPCNMIMQDEMLKALIEQSIDQMKVKKQKIGKTTKSPFISLAIPSMENEKNTRFHKSNDIGLSKVHRTWTMKKQKRTPQHVINQSAHLRTHQLLDRESKEIKIKNTKHRVYNGRKKLRRFYPHKIKSTDKKNKYKNTATSHSGQKRSMSVETPDDTLVHQHLMNYRVEPAEDPVWRIDYTKHGEPSLNVFGEDQLKGKIIKSGTNVIVDEQILEQAARKDVLPPNVYIKTKTGRKKTLRISPDIREKKY